ncbi:Catalyzes the cleavage of p-aminobenzoyl-glutamate to p-aminobenzoate and glutamate, subunit A [Pseudonocardia sp. Ae168_Ps1]|uniref:M20 family metallopeptidase n=1 Tax=unclassified Pseudonocardia TaxID=2619320 RepID=UPI000961CC98|nr:MULTISPECIES: M20 family metallopeptidase [unclassified Pseudonocardia]OLL72869.1 Catalyzes the cleavage of p-aminobenzoyl-glutamate to p-aminobenzoate and glutamate, subunit A [Pseudonocardia sp. Ae150A_Ps1]OLL78843.1 Catalyzes the cleavage of p-aminobenzoyl-glutamate to p-aminobenzoate and glutamate, subunit A [Pseudonocardia sp. Ae168_Ps1]OLL87030.1 Catalyzes the cleavage of p-aminobenzoyl-glutamate to p-aminobenzoate and glutamate, subunit A [Pseudonocardia sp. Ae263_Ps1]OLL92939.1 Catal
MALSHRIHAHPELAFSEIRASTWVAEALAGAGFAVEHGCHGLPTAVRATIGTGPVHVGICAEYDALPGIGHACGHNVIAAAAVGAGLGLARVADDLGLTVTVLGTLAEEGGGGKALMLERGAFDGLDAAMMVHPAAVEMAAMPGSAVSVFDVTYRGVPAHAGAYPERGINAADAMTVAQVAIGLLRQQTTGTDRIQGVVTEAGNAANVIPDLGRGRWIVRTGTVDELGPLTRRVQRCFEAGALATGCDLELGPACPDYADLRPDPGLLARYRANAEALGRTFPELPVGGVVGAATDMGNVSHVVPTIHPMLGLDCAPAVNHQPEFTAAAISPAADRAVLDGAIAMAWTAADLAAGRPGA